MNTDNNNKKLNSIWARGLLAKLNEGDWLFI